MKLISRIAYALFMTMLVTSSYQCSSQKNTVLQTQTEVKINEIVFQEWYAGIKVGGTGFNIFIPNLTSNDKITFEKVYFRNLQGELVQDKGMFTAVLANSSPFYTWEYPEKPEDYPFDLAPNECVITYTENGELKHVRIANVSEKAGTYYENGHPSIYAGDTTPVFATVEED